MLRTILLYNTKLEEQDADELAFIYSSRYNRRRSTVFKAAQNQASTHRNVKKRPCFLPPLKKSSRCCSEIGNETQQLLETDGNKLPTQSQVDYFITNYTVSCG